MQDADLDGRALRAQHSRGVQRYGGAERGGLQEPTAGD
jgi:hypothetical protein